MAEQTRFCDECGARLERSSSRFCASCIHPDTEEAMVIVEGTLEAVLGDEVVTLKCLPHSEERYATTVCWEKDELEQGRDDIGARPIFQV